MLRNDCVVLVELFLIRGATNRYVPAVTVRDKWGLKDVEIVILCALAASKSNGLYGRQLFHAIQA